MEPSVARICKNFWKFLSMAKVSFLGDTTLYHVYLYLIIPALKQVLR